MRTCVDVVRLVVLAFACAVGTAFEAEAQSESGGAALSGVVRDQAGEVVPGVAITARQEATGAVRSTITDAAGRFSLAAMPVGSFAVDATLAGFSTARYEQVMLTVGRTTTLTVTLQAAGVAENVTVTAAPTLDREGTTSGTVLDQRTITDLPIRGRNFAEFAQLSPMVLQEGDRGGLVIAGQRSINSNVSIDGADFNDPQQGNQRGGNETAFFFPQSAVREFQVVHSGVGAEVGRTGGGFINVVTRSGANLWQGDAFYYNRNKTLTSADAFGRKHANLGQNQFGGGIGGALVKDRAFVFGAVEQNLLRVPFTVKFQEQAPGVVVPAELLALQGDQTGTNNPIAWFGRVDTTLSSAHTLNVQVMQTRLKGENFDFETAQSDRAVSANYSREAASGAVKVSFLSTLGRSMLSEVRAQVATDNRLENPNSTEPQITIVGFGTFGGDNARPRQNDASRVQLMQNVSWSGQRHDLRLGWDLNVTHYRTRREFFIQGQYDFANLNDYRAGRISRYRQTVARNDPADLLYEATGQELALYVQDRVRVGSRLTLTGGLRWEGQWNPDPPNPNPLFPETAVIPDDLSMWQPRLGLAWDARGNGRTIVRTSAGIYNSRTPSVLFARVATDNGLTTTVIDSRFDPSILPLLPYPNALTTLPPNAAITFPQPVLGFDPDFRNPRTFQTAVAVDHEIGRRFQVTGGYTHARAWFLQRRLDHNLFAPTDNQFGLPIYPATRPMPAFARVSFNESTARAEYHAFSVSLIHRPIRRFQAQAHYTLAYNKDHDSNERTTNQEPALNVFNTELDWSWSKQDVRHNFNASAVVDVPYDITVSAILLTRSAFPFTPIIGTDQQRDGNELNDRAIINGRVAERFSMRQPAFFSLDLRLVKAFRFGRHRVDLVADALNVTRASNKNFGVDATSVYGTPASPVATAGQPLSAPSTARFGGPRQLQLGIRASF